MKEYPIFEAAKLGYGTRLNFPFVAVYDFDKCVDILQKEHDMTFEQAIEWMEFNVVNAYMGEDTPIFIWEKPDPDYV